MPYNIDQSNAYGLVTLNFGAVADSDTIVQLPVRPILLPERVLVLSFQVTAMVLGPQLVEGNDATAIFTVATVGGSLLIGLGLALLLNRRLVGRGVARTVVFAPYVLSGIAVGILWLFIFDPRYGLMSTALAWLGLSSPDWYNDSPWALSRPMVRKIIL